jgi:deazaflavin-dependent oxidoreductase (nitroreductase family)
VLRDDEGHLPDRLVRAISTFHSGIYRLTRGRIGRRLADNDMLLLMTAGRASGKPHTVPLLYLRDGDDLIVMASYGGRHHHPEWYRNLVAEPDAEVRVDGRRVPVRATTTEGTDRARLWERAVTAYDGFRTYQGRTDREIPIVRLTPRRASSPSPT